MTADKARLPKKAILFFAVLALLTPLLAKASFVYEIPEENNSRYYFRIVPGGTSKNYIYVTNTGTAEEVMNIYGADAIQTAEGSFAAKTLDAEQVNMGKWIKFKETSITLQPKEKTKIEFEITVPKEATPGTYAGALALSSTPKQTGAQGGMGLQTVGRLIVKVLVDIPGDKIFGYNWKSLIYEAGEDKKDHSFKMNFSNTGNTPVVIEGEVRIFGGPDGQDEATRAEWENQTQELTVVPAFMQKNEKDPNVIPINNITLYSGDDVNIPVTWEKQPVYGSYKAVAKITFSELDPITQEKKNPKTIIKEIDFSVTPWNYIFIALAVVLLVIGVSAYRLISFTALKKTYIPYKVAEKDTLEKIASARNANWKKIAKVNKIKAPYTITEGKTILVPPIKKQ